MVLPLILLWDEGMSREEFIKQLYVYDSELHYLSMAQGIGTFNCHGFINICRAREDESHYFTPCWSTAKGTHAVYRPLSRREVS